MLTDTFIQLINKYSNNNELATNLWLEIFSKYSEPKRHYHTISHLEAMLTNLTEVKDKITDWDTTLLAVFYHDSIYKASSNTNEGDSAKLAMQKLSEIGYPAPKIANCANMIVATKLHEKSEDNDTNYLLDADLTILGANPYEYQKYTEQIREEYSLYPDFMYNTGRKKALQHFIHMEIIYKTEHFFKKYEKQARINIMNELETLK